MLEISKQYSKNSQIQNINSDDSLLSTTQDLIQNKSEYLQQYKQFFNQKEEENQSYLFYNNDYIAYEQDGQYQQLHTQIVKNTQNYEIVYFKAKFGLFSIYVKMLNVDGKSQTHQFSRISSTFASIYINHANQDPFVIKCFSYNQNNAEIIMASVLKEYCFLKIAALLNIGPSLNNIFGFDLVVFEDCIQFAMQKCQLITDLNPSLINDLKNKLKQLHQLKIVHMDIKPANICFRPNKNELVFIDFGLTKFIKENVGFKTLTYFSGSLGFCCPDMVQRYTQNQGYVDLYYNDVHCLIQSFQEIKKSLKQSKFRNNQCQEQFSFNYSNFNLKRVLNCYLQYRIKYMIFDDQSALLKVFQQNKIINYKELISFISKLPYSAFLEKWYYIFLKQITTNQREVKSYFNIVLKNQGGFIKFISNKIICQNQNYIDFEERIKYIQISQKDIFLLNQDLTRKISKQNLKILLNDSHLIANIKNQTYMCQFIIYIDFRTNLSTFSQKLQVSQTMIKHFELKNNIVSPFAPIQTCLLYIKTYLLTSQPKNAQYFLPIIFSNLLILQTLTAQQIIIFMIEMTKIKVYPLAYAKLLLRCSFAIEWFSNRSISRYSSLKLYSKITQIILNQIIALAQKWKYKSFIIPLISDLLRANKDIISIQNIISQIKYFLENEQMQISSQFKTELLIFYLSIRINKQLSLLRDDRALQTMRLINSLQNMGQNYQHRFQYYHFLMIKVLMNTSNHKVLFAMLQKFKQCLQHPKLIQNYQIYFYCNQLKFSELSSYQFYRQFLLKYLNDEEFLQNNELLLHINLFLYQKNIGEIQQIKSQLRLRFKFQKIITSKFPQNSHLSNFVKFYNNWSSIIFIYYKLFYQYLTLFQFQQQLQQITTKLQSFWNKIVCLQCKKKSLIELVMIKGSIYQFLKNDQYAITLFMNYLNAAVSQDSDMNRKLSIVMYIMEISLQNQQLAKSKDSFQFVFQYIKKQNQYQNILSKTSNKNPVIFLNWYILSKNKDVQQLYKLQNTFNLILKQFPYEQNILFYASQAELFMTHLSQHNEVITEYLKQNLKNIQSDPNQKSILFYSICLKYYQVFDTSLWKLVIFICQILQFQSNTSKQLILINVYNKLIDYLQQISSLNQIQLLTLTKNPIFYWNTFLLKQKNSQHRLIQSKERVLCKLVGYSKQKLKKMLYFRSINDLRKKIFIKKIQTKYLTLLQNFPINSRQIGKIYPCYETLKQYTF